MSDLEERLRQQLPALAARMVERHAAGAGRPVTSIWPRRPNKARRLIQLAAAVALLAAAASVAVTQLVDQPHDQVTTTPPSSTPPTETIPATTTLPETESEATTEPPTPTQPEPTPTAEDPPITQPEPEPLAASPCTSPAVVDQALDALVGDCEALWDFYLLQDAKQRFDSDPAIAWNATNPLQKWRGVTVADWRVTELRLAYFDLSGRLTGSLEDLTHLEHLDLSHNQLSGPIPAEFGSLVRLTHLNLSDNQLSEWIPQELRNLTQLEHVDLSHNQLVSTLGQFFRLNRLEHLDP